CAKDRCWRFAVRRGRCPVHQRAVGRAWRRLRDQVRERAKGGCERCGRLSNALAVHHVDEVAVLLPDPSSRILTRELMYTAVTRARKSMIVCGTEGHTRPPLARTAQTR